VVGYCRFKHGYTVFFKGYLPFQGGGWRHLFSGHCDLPEEKCRPRPRF